jgi:hypothetical protein
LVKREFRGALAVTNLSRSASAGIVLVADDLPASVELLKTFLTREG